MSARDLGQWLAYQEQVNPRGIELGLERVRRVWQRMGAPSPARRMITVGGTNGKGSSVALLEAMLRQAGLRVGCYTSPHLLDYNERVRIEGVNASDAALVDAFERIEAARLGQGGEQEIKLTYFEFGTLAALDLFARADLDVAVLEVGLGGRLDAVNIIDADAVLITTVDLDHMDWLGPDRDTIGAEKAGIARAGRPAIVGEAEPPQGLLDALQAREAVVCRAGQQFSYRLLPQGHWCWQDGAAVTLELPPPALLAPVQYANAAAAVATLWALWPAWRELPALAGAPADFVAALGPAIQAALGQVQVPARLQRLAGTPELIVDVGHNPQAARALAQWLDAQPRRPLHAVYGALADKDVAGVIAALADRVDQWHLADLAADTPRGLPAAALAGQLREAAPQAVFDSHPGVTAALAAARQAAPASARILAFGSFFVASAVLAAEGPR